MSDIVKDIITIASDLTGIDKSKLHRNTTIGKDLKIDGNDVVDLLREIEKKYVLNYDGFDFKKYFTPESEINVIRSFIKYFFRKKKEDNYQLTIGDIEKWILKGYWEERT